MSKPKSERRVRGAILSVRLSPCELEHLQERAYAHDSTISSYVRDKAIGRVEPATFVCPHMSISGALLGTPRFSCGCKLARQETP